MMLTARQLCLHAPAALLAVTALAAPWLERTMARHMGIELPLLVMLGWAAAWSVGGRWERLLPGWNARGLPGLLVASCVMAFWMLPVSLDLAVLHASVGVAKVASLVVAGMALKASWRAAGTVIQAFVVLNGAWMTLTAGLLYQSAPQQLCSVYLVDQQQRAGQALVMWGLAILALWLWRVARQSIRTETL